MPEKFQVPLVLCYLEGLTQEEVSRRLGWPIGTVRSRLARGRERLRLRLVVRGVAPAAAAMAVGAWRQAEAVVVPESLVAATARAAAAQAGAAGVVSTAVATLTEEVLKTMFATKLKLNAAAVLMIGVIATGAGVVAGQAGGRPGQGTAGGASAPAAVVPTAEQPEGRPDGPLTFSFTIDRVKAAELGLTARDVMNNVAAALQNASPATSLSFRVDSTNENQFFIRVPPSEWNKHSIEKLRSILITRLDQPGQPCPLGNLATIERMTRKDIEAETKARQVDLAKTRDQLEVAEVGVLEAQAILEQARAKAATAEAARSKARARFDALRGGSGSPAPKEALPVAKRDAPAASDQERRLRAVEEKLDRLLADRAQPLEAIKGPPPRPEVVSPVEMAAVWQRLHRDGIIGRFGADAVAPEEFYTMLYLRYLGRGPSTSELNPLLASYSPDPDQKRVDPENTVRRMLRLEAFWKSPLAPVLLREPAPRGDRPR